MEIHSARLLYWMPRVLCILYAAFLSVFALDVFDGSGFWPTLIALSIHLIPTAAILVILLLAWRWEWIGAGAYFALALLYVRMAGSHHPDWIAVVAGPLLLVAVLFLLNWIRRGKSRPPRTI